MKTVGLIGWRGMVGSVLMHRMHEEHDFKHFQPVFFSTSQAGKLGPKIEGAKAQPLEDAYDFKKLSEMDIILTCQGSEYTQKVHGALRQQGWQGQWIDAASSLRMSESATIILDPINSHQINHSIETGIKDFIGGNCTVSLMLMALGGLFKANKVEWVSSMTYQAASGGGAKNMRELLLQMRALSNATNDLLNNPAEEILKIDQRVQDVMRSPDMPTEFFGVPLAGSLIPWIDTAVEAGQTREEWKGISETNKILGLQKNEIPIDGTCVRIGAMRCHSQGFTVKLTENLPIDEVKDLIVNCHPWVEWVDNEKQATLEKLTPQYTTGTLKIPVGRVRKMHMGPEYLNVFSVGDQLLWGAAEPLRRVLRILLEAV